MTKDHLSKYIWEQQIIPHRCPVDIRDWERFPGRHFAGLCDSGSRRFGEGAGEHGQGAAPTPAAAAGSAGAAREGSDAAAGRPTGRKTRPRPPPGCAAQTQEGEPSASGGNMAPVSHRQRDHPWTLSLLYILPTF